MDLNLLIVPVDPEFTPTGEDQDRAKEMLETDERAPLSDGVYVYSYGSARLAGSIEATSGMVRCPECGRGNDVRGLQDDWWRETERRLSQSEDPREDVIEMPCCHAKVKAIRLDLGTGARFARFFMEIVNPGEGECLSPDLLESLQHVLKCDLVQLEQWET